MLLPCQSTFHIFTSFGLYWLTFLLYQPISFFELPRPIYFLYTSFTPMGFLLNHLVFLDPITTSLSLITFQAYWPLSQPNEFTNSFPELSRPIYFLITSYCSHGFTTSFIGFPRPIYFLFTSYYSCGPGGHYSCLSSLLGLLYYFLFSLSSYCWTSSAIGPFVKSGHQHMSSKVVSN